MVSCGPKSFNHRDVATPPSQFSQLHSNCEWVISAIRFGTLWPLDSVSLLLEIVQVTKIAAALGNLAASHFLIDSD